MFFRKLRILENLRTAISGVYTETMGPSGAAVLRAAVLGDRSEFSGRSAPLLSGKRMAASGDGFRSAFVFHCHGIFTGDYAGGAFLWFCQCFWHRL